MYTMIRQHSNHPGKEKPLACALIGDKLELGVNTTAYPMQERSFGRRGRTLSRPPALTELTVDLLNSCNFLPAAATRTRMTTPGMLTISV